MPDVTEPIVVGGLGTMTPSFLRHPRATNKSPKTIRTYRDAATQLEGFLSERGMPTDVAANLGGTRSDRSHAGFPDACGDVDDQGSAPACSP